MSPIKLLSVSAIVALALAPAAKAVDLEFGWKAGMTCKVRQSMHVEKGRGKSDVAVKYDLTVTAAPGGDLFVTISNPDMDPTPGVPEAQRGLIANQIVATNMPDLRVHANGELAGLRDYDAARATLKATYEKLMPSARQNPKAVDQALATVGTREFITATAASFWTPAVDRWASLKIETGKPVRYTESAPTPIGFPVTMKGAVELVSQAACHGGNAARRCVLLKSTETGDPEEMKKGLTEFVAKQDPKVDTSGMQSLSLTRAMEAETEPDTLIPRRVLFVKTINVSGVENGLPRSMSQVERREWFFDCKEPAATGSKP